MTIEDTFGEINTVLLRLNLLLENGYHMNTSKDVFATVWLDHTFKKELDIILYPDGRLVILGTPGVESRKILEENHDEFLEFIKSLPKINFFQRIFSWFLRGGEVR